MNIKIEIKNRLNALRDIGQSYDGIIQKLINSYADKEGINIQQLLQEKEDSK